MIQVNSGGEELNSEGKQKGLSWLGRVVHSRRLMRVMQRHGFAFFFHKRQETRNE